MTPDQAQAINQPGRGRDAEAPLEIPPAGWKDIAYRLFRAINEDRILLAAAGTTFYLLLALVPTLSAFVSLYGLFNSRASAVDHVALLVGIVPAGGLDIIRDQLTRLAGESNGALGFTLLLSLALAFWSASAGIRALFEAMNVAYHEKEKRSFFVVIGISLLFTLATAVAALLVVGTVIVLPPLLSLLPGAAGLEWLVRVASYAVMLLVILLGIAALYRWGPSRQEAKWRWITPGATLCVVSLGITSIGFSFYVSNFSDYNATYGSLGALIGLLTWMWISVTLVIAGAELNSEVEHQTARDSTTGPARPLGSRGAYMADNVGRIWPPDRKAVARKMAPVRRRDPVSFNALALFSAVIVLGALRKSPARPSKQ